MRMTSQMREKGKLIANYGEHSVAKRVNLHAAYK